MGGFMYIEHEMAVEDLEECKAVYYKLITRVGGVKVLANGVPIIHIGDEGIELLQFDSGEVWLPEQMILEDGDTSQLKVTGFDLQTYFNRRALK